MKYPPLFITGTDTGVGKTITTLCLGYLLQNQGVRVGVMKPVQCGGNDAQFLKNSLQLADSLETINPCYSRYPLSPHLAFKKEGKRINLQEILSRYEILKARYDVLLIEGAGGLMVPLSDNYFVYDLIRDLEAQVIVVSRLALGTINHTLLTIEQVREKGLPLRGVIFSQTKNKNGIPEKTNPREIEKLGRINIIGTVPFLKELVSLRPPRHPPWRGRGATNGSKAISVNARLLRRLTAPRNDMIPKILKVCRFKINLRSLLKRSIANARSQLSDWDKQYVWHPFTQMKDWLTEEPLIIDQARGSYLIDTKGNRYLDGVSSLWVNVHGHNHPAINRAIKSQVDKLSHSTLLGLSNTPAIALAKKLVEITPKGLEKVFYSDNGSTAVEIAIKMAYQYWQNIGKKKKTGIMHLANSYHGDTLGSVSVGGIDLFHKVYRKLIFKTIAIDFPDGYRAPKGKKYPDYAFEYVDKFEALLKNKHQTAAALVVEPIVQGAAGMIMWPPGILRKMAALCKKYDVILIVDEVATGFGRTGTMFACEQEGVSPDIMCLAKGITGGYLPLAATLTTKKIFDGFCFDYKDMKTFFHGHTYTGNPLGCAAALANLQVFEKERVLKKLAPKIKHLQRRLAMFYNLPAVGDVRQRGFMAGIELVKDRSTKEPYPWQAKIGVEVCRRVREKGVILRPLGNVIVLMPPLSLSMEELDQLFEATYWAIKEVTQHV